MIKSQLRKKYLLLRQQLSPLERTQAENNIAQAFLSFLDKTAIYPNIKIAAYAAFGTEVRLTPLIDQLWQRKTDIFLPILQTETASLAFASYTTHSLMKKNIYGIDEPDRREYLALRALDVALIPLLAFNRQGTRLGMGKGYYDRSFAFRREHNIKPLLIGIAYACQESDELFAEAWDVPLDAIITEKEWIWRK